MLEPRAPRPDRETNPIISVRLSEGEWARVDWLTERLNMNRSELVKALINQEYVAQYEATQTKGT